MDEIFFSYSDFSTLLYRYNNGSYTLHQTLERVILFIIVWGNLIPIVASEAILSYRDDVIYSIIKHRYAQTTVPTVLTCMIPILVLSGFMFIFSFILSYLFKTSFQVHT